MKILIADDSRITRKHIERHLNIDGITTVLHAPNGEEALAIFREQLPEFVTLDLTMAKIGGMDCIEAMLKLRADAKIVIISAMNDKEIASQALAKGAQGYLTKPFLADKLNEVFKDKDLI
jgi:two-component system chemotaxis response regulator CheY